MKNVEKEKIKEYPRKKKIILKNKKCKEEENQINNKEIQKMYED